MSDRLIQLRTEKNIMQKDVAAVLGLSIAGYQRYEYGTRQPTADILIKLADYYEVSTDYLLGITENSTRL